MLTGFQFRAALGALKITDTNFSSALHINRTTVYTLKRTNFHEFLKCQPVILHFIEEYFKKQMLGFAHDAEISLIVNKDIRLDLKKFTVFQARASRATLGMSLERLALQTKINHNILFKFEQGNIDDYIVGDEVILNVLREFYSNHKICYPNDFTLTLEK